MIRLNDTYQQMSVNTGTYYVEASVRNVIDGFDNKAVMEDITSNLSEKHMLGIFLDIADEIEDNDVLAPEAKVEKAGTIYRVNANGLNFMAIIHSAYRLEPVEL